MFINLKKFGNFAAMHRHINKEEKYIDTINIEQNINFHENKIK